MTITEESIIGILTRGRLTAGQIDQRAQRRGMVDPSSITAAGPDGCCTAAPGRNEPQIDNLLASIEALAAYAGPAIAAPLRHDADAVIARFWEIDRALDRADAGNEQLERTLRRSTDKRNELERHLRDDDDLFDAVEGLLAVVDRLATEAVEQLRYTAMLENRILDDAGRSTKAMSRPSGYARSMFKRFRKAAKADAAKAIPARTWPGPGDSVTITVDSTGLNAAVTAAIDTIKGP